MSEKPKSKHLTQAQFFQVCQELLNRREVYTTEKPTYAKAAQMISRQLGFEISDNSVPNAMEATGVTWESRGTTTASQRKNLAHCVREIASQVKALCEEMGVKPQSGFLRAWSELTGRPLKEEPGIPVKDVPPASSIPIVNGRKSPP